MLKSKVEEERYIKEERDEMAIEAFEYWLVSHTSLFMASESVCVIVEHFYRCKCFSFVAEYF